MDGTNFIGVKTYVREYVGGHNTNQVISRVTVLDLQSQYTTAGVGQIFSYVDISQFV